MFEMSTDVGTHFYKPIEVELENYSESIDMWCVGLILYLCVSEYPFKIVEENGSYVPVYCEIPYLKEWNAYTLEMKDLV